MSGNNGNNTPSAAANTQPLLMTKKTKSCNNNTMQIALHTAIEDWNKSSNPQKSATPPADDLIEVASASSSTKPSTPTTSSIVSDQMQVSSKITTIPYHSGNPTVYLVKGLIHLYKDRFERKF